MKIGILYCAFNCEEYLDKSLTPWVSARASGLMGHEFVISVVSVPFEEYKDIEIKADETPAKLAEYLKSGAIDSLIVGPKFVKEHVARNNALKYLLNRSVDYVILWDGDEVPTEDNIKKILHFVYMNNHIDWFSISYKNFVFDEKTYLVDPFCPPRIFKVLAFPWKIFGFFWDNDIQYIEYSPTDGMLMARENKTYTDLLPASINPSEGMSYTRLPGMIIPPSVAWVDHYTWIDNEKTRAKVAYQNKHFGGKCGYQVNPVTSKLEFNELYYRSIGTFTPIVSSL